MKEHKIIIAGPMGAGKTTAIAAVSDVAPIVTDVTNNDRGVDKAMTTVGFDYGQLTLDTGDRVRLYGTPGQERFRFVWQAVSTGALGLILLTDNTRPNPLADLKLCLEGFSQALTTLPCVVGVGRTEAQALPDLQAYADLLAEHGHVFPVLPVDVRQRDDVLLLLDVLLAQMEADLS